jgi:integrase
MKFHLKTDFVSSPPKVFQRKKGGNYYYRRQIGGNDIWRSLKTKNKKEAEQLAYRIWYQQQGQTLRDILQMPALPLDVAWELHSESEKYANLADSTKKMRQKYFNSFKNWCELRNIYTVNDISEQAAILYLSSLGKTNKTFNNVLNDLRQTFTQVYTELKLDNIFSTISPRSTTKGTRTSTDYRSFSMDEIKTIFTLLEQSNIEYKSEWITACYIALYTGLRYKDIALLQWYNIKDMEIIELIPHKTKATGKTVLIPIAPPLLPILQKLKKTGFYLLPGLASTYSDRSTKHFQRLIQRNKSQFAPGKIGFHSFRSTFITWAAESGIDLETIGGIVGHTSTRMTDHYNKSAITADLTFLQDKQIS